jgi:hypothetical protein
MSSLFTCRWLERSEADAAAAESGARRDEAAVVVMVEAEADPSFPGALDRLRVGIALREQGW